jgi:hypothetical protein
MIMKDVRFEFEGSGTWETLTFRPRFSEWVFSAADSDGHVEVMSGDTSTGDTQTMYLNQDELKVLVGFLQKQIKE